MCGMIEPTTSTEDTSGGDLSRRVAHRRTELGLSLDEVAKRTGIDPAYLQYLEHNATARLSVGSLILLAMTLKTSPDFLLGGHAPLRRERGGMGHHPSVQALSSEQCRVHLESAVYGRVVYATARGPVAIPVNYEYTNDQVVISTDPNKAKALARAGVVGFEVDHVDQDMSEGWSVLVTGPARRVTASDERMALSSIGLESWSEGGTHDLVAITPREITGRVIVHPIPWAN
jgi:nitroimidazol reductase NimA-like FMN-containing flavoprotein (pyridoxamine 5'-phosphate oxidase superfamily)